MRKDPSSTRPNYIGMVVTPKEVLYTVVDRSFPGKEVDNLMHVCIN